jgi:hypothetical protein
MGIPRRDMQLPTFDASCPHLGWQSPCCEWPLWALNGQNPALNCAS